MEVDWCWKEVFNFFISNAVQVGRLDTSAYLPGYKKLFWMVPYYQFLPVICIVLLVDWHSGSCLVSSFQLLSRVQLFVIPWTAARQASLSITNSESLPKLISIELVITSNHLILCCPLLLLPSIFPNIRVFSNESALRMRWPKYWSFSFSISPSKEHPGLISSRMDWLDLLEVQGTLKSLLRMNKKDTFLKIN